MGPGQPLLDAFETRLQRVNHHLYGSDELLDRACFYALSRGGKRVRPLLTLLSRQLFTPGDDRLNPAAVAIEMVHTYSLIHDDLPMLDDDDLRRGFPTVHKEFDEPTALLAGDALLTDAFRVLADPACLGESCDPGPDQPARQVGMIRELAGAAGGAGGAGMVRGQMLDVYWTGRAGGGQAELEDIHLNKTARLIGAACAMGAIAGGAGPEDTRQLRLYGQKLGMTFQLIDDLLDEQDSDHTGKSSGKDRAQGKLTRVSVHGRAAAEELARAWTAEARAMLDGRGAPGKRLNDYATWLLNRSH